MTFSSAKNDEFLIPNHVKLERILSAKRKITDYEKVCTQFDYHASLL